MDPASRATSPSLTAAAGVSLRIGPDGGVGVTDGGGATLGNPRARRDAPWPCALPGNNGCDRNANRPPPFALCAFDRRTLPIADGASHATADHTGTLLRTFYVCPFDSGLTIRSRSRFPGASVCRGPSTRTLGGGGELHLGAGQALPARAAIEGALDRGRYRIEAGSQAAPRPPARAPRKASAPCARPRKSTTCFRLPRVMCWELRCACRLIYLASSSSMADTVSVLAQTDALRRPFFLSHPLPVKPYPVREAEGPCDPGWPRCSDPPQRTGHCASEGGRLTPSASTRGPHSRYSLIRTTAEMAVFS